MSVIKSVVRKVSAVTVSSVTLPSALGQPMSAVNLADRNYTSSEIDDRLNYLADNGITGQIILIYGNDPRTSASNDAYILLTTPISSGGLGNFIISDRV